MLHSRLKEELDNMEKSDITDWFNALVVVEKPYTGKLGVCLDPRNCCITVTDLRVILYQSSLYQSNLVQFMCSYSITLF